MIKASARAVIAMFESQKTYHEKVSNSNLDSFHENNGSNNWHKFGRDLYNAKFYNGNKNGYDWCTTSATWAAYKAFGLSTSETEKILCHLGRLAAGTIYWVNYFKEANQWGSKPKLGAYIFFYAGTTEASHVGVVRRFDKNYVYTVEGNKNNEVSFCKYDLNDKDIYGYGYPLYEDEDSFDPAVYPKPDDMEIGSQGEWVIYLQSILIELGYKIDGGVDGDFGEHTLEAVKQFQKDTKITVDGCVGPTTWYTLELVQASQPEMFTNNSNVAFLQILLEYETTGDWTENFGTYLNKKAYLKLNSKGLPVRFLQYRLRKLGINSSIEIDGDFGNQTKTAVIEFQKSFGLETDGEVGKLTWNKLCRD